MHICVRIIIKEKKAMTLSGSKQKNMREVRGRGHRKGWMQETKGEKVFMVL